MSALLALLVSGSAARADWGSLHYGGWQPWWNPFAHRQCLSPEEERLQRFWHDYYDALRRYYGMLDHIDWVAYYKNHGYQINAGCGGGGGGGCGCGPQRIQFAPVFVSPTMNWAVPNSAVSGPPCQPPLPPASMYGYGGMGPVAPMGGFAPQMPMPPYYPH
jgi:hypothetical protein